MCAPPPLRLLIVLLVAGLLLSACDDGNPLPPAPPAPPASGGGTTQPAHTDLLPTATTARQPASEPSVVASADRSDQPVVTAVDVDIAVYALVTRDLAARLAPATASSLYLNQGAASGSSLEVKLDSPPVPAALLNSLGMAARFARFAEVLDRSAPDGAVVKDGAAYITLGMVSYFDANNNPLTDGVGAMTAMLRGSVYQSRTQAKGMLYTLRGGGNNWQVQAAKEEWRGQ